MKNKQNLLILIPLGCAVVVGCWSAESVGNRTPGGSTSTPSSSSSASPTSSDTKNNNNSSKGNSETNTQLNNNQTNQVKSGGFQGNLPSGFQIPTDDVGKKMLKEYGAMFLARNVTPPPKVVFRDEADVSAFQSGVQKASENIDGITIELQSAAMNALKEAIAEAKTKNLSISPNNADSSRRSYQSTVNNWNDRVDRGMKHWVPKGKLTQAEATRIKSLSVVDQIPEIFKLESQGIYFALSLDKSIIYSVAPPGTSQHISMLALDVKQFANPSVRQVLANHGWFQTIPSDLPHFTYLGVKESELPGLGLKKVTNSGQTFWVPDI